MATGLKIRVRGQVQGVGFRPFIHRLAKDFQATGHVLNDAEGVLIFVACSDPDGFVAGVTDRAPPLSRIDALALNLVSSPGSGKTTLLCKTISALGDRPLAVIEGDQQTSNDADRIRETGAKAVQVNTGKGCHLDGHMVGHAMDHLELGDGAMLFIENVGNLVRPAAFDLGEDAKVAILSVTEGEDKPLKYPDMFTASRLALLNKVDLAPHCDVDLDLYEENLRRVNPTIEIIRISARTGEGMDAWIGWLDVNLLAKSKQDAAE